MGRKRLMTMLAAMVVAMGLHAAPAAAQTLSLPGVEVDLEDGLEVGLDVEVSDDLALDPKLEVGGEQTVVVDGGIKAGDTRIDLGETRESAPTPEPSPSPPPAEPPAQEREPERESVREEDRPASGHDRNPDEQVEAAAGGVQDWTPTRRAQFEAFRALRSHDFSFAATQSSVLPGVQLAPRRDGEDEVGHLVYDAPQVAPGVTAASPGETRPGSTLAVAPAATPLDEVPAPLQALTALLIAGTAIAWNLTRRELGWALSGLRRRD